MAVPILAIARDLDHCSLFRLRSTGGELVLHPCPGRSCRSWEDLLKHRMSRTFVHLPRRALALGLALLSTIALLQPGVAAAAPSQATAILDEEVSQRLA